MSWMAGPQSSPRCVPPGLLLLLVIQGLSTYLPDVNAKPIDFWCSKNKRQRMMTMIPEMNDKIDCHLLRSPVRLPCVSMNAAEWENKTLQQKHAEVSEAFQVFEEGVRHIDQTLECQKSFLAELKHSITNYVHIVSKAPLQADNQTSYSPGQIFCNKTSLVDVLKQYKTLLQGKLYRFAEDLQRTPMSCPNGPSINDNH